LPPVYARQETDQAAAGRTRFGGGAEATVEPGRGEIGTGPEGQQK
jgi:hypothetical protein